MNFVTFNPRANEPEVCQIKCPEGWESGRVPGSGYFRISSKKPTTNNPELDIFGWLK